MLLTLTMLQRQVMMEFRKGKSSTVFIDKQKNIVIKKFDKKQSKEYVRGLGYHCYLRELECLRRLEGHQNFPKLLDYDDEDLSITMEYCGEQYPTDGQSNPELVQQVYDMVYKLEEQNIKFVTVKFPFNNIHIKDGILKFIDFENCLPEDSDNIPLFTKLFVDSHRELFNMQDFEDKLKILVTKGVVIKGHKYSKILSEANNMVKNEWNNYQKSNEGNSAKWRIDNLDLRQFAGKDKTLLDLGANHGEFGVELSKDFMHITALEPFVDSPELPDNMTWIKKGFKDFIAESNDTYDVVFSFAMTIQVRDVDGFNEDQIAKGHYDLVKEGGIMIYETQKLEGRPLNQAHVDKMLNAFRAKFGNETTSGNARVSGRRKYYIFKK